MAGLVGKYAANKMLSKQMAQYRSKKPAGDDDPYFAYIDHPRKPGQKKKVKKTIPSYIPEDDANVLAKMRRRSYRLDMALFDFLGTRFGWSSVIGIIPAAGDALDAGIALILVRSCMKVKGGLPINILVQMLFNVAVDFLIGLVPFLGDIADAYFKANTRNCRLLEKHLDSMYKPDALKTRSTKNAPPATAYEDFSDEEGERNDFIRQTDGAHDVRHPEPTADRTTRKNGGWFGFGGGKGQRLPDVERGEAPTYGNTRPTHAAPTHGNTYAPQETGTVYSDRR